MSCESGYMLPSHAWDKESIKRAIRDNLIHHCGADPESASSMDWLIAVTKTVRAYLLERWVMTRRHYTQEHSKRVFYLSMEFLIGRLLTNALLNTGLYESMRLALEEMGLDLARIVEDEPDAALGNGGLGRLAACIVDAMATMGVPGYGYGIRYDFGMFRQEIKNGCQVEQPDEWLRYGNPWEVPHPEHGHTVRFYGHVEHHGDNEGRIRQRWVDGVTVYAVGHDYPVPGFGVENVNDLRLWSARASREFDLQQFNAGDYIGSVEQKILSENISRVLYPNDASQSGRELRLQQEYFFVSASLQDILTYHLQRGYSLSDLARYNAIQLNDTHPAIAVAELMRLLIFEHKIEWDEAWEITRQTLSYTNHTLMPEALETWPVAMIQRVLPLHMQIIYDINYQFLDEVRRQYPDDEDLVKRVSLIDEVGEKSVRMAHLAVVGSHTVNGVADLHTRLLKETLFADFARLMPQKFVNVTNGVTQRLWIHQINRELSSFLKEVIGNKWIRDLSQLKLFEPFAEKEIHVQRYRSIKLNNKKRLATYIHRNLGVDVDPNALFDVQIKRIHEYKRQMLNLLHVISLYNQIRDGHMPPPGPRVVIFGGKAAPAYEMAKRIICLINDVAKVVNHDPSVGDLLKCVFIPNYGVTLAGLIIPAADLSEQISTAGTEASGTSNMKLSMNGALTIGTLDGANIEIRDEVGEENIFIFGLRSEDVRLIRENGYDPRSYAQENPELYRVLTMIGDGYFCPEDPAKHRGIVDSLLNEDRFMILADYAAYMDAQRRVGEMYALQPLEWTRKCMINTARMGRFSIDRTVSEYTRIWNVDCQPLISAD